MGSDQILDWNCKKVKLPSTLHDKVAVTTGMKATSRKNILVIYCLPFENVDWLISTQGSSIACDNLVQLYIHHHWHPNVLMELIYTMNRLLLLLQPPPLLSCNPITLQRRKQACSLQRMRVKLSRSAEGAFHTSPARSAGNNKI
jgi:hypothetical protein